MSARRVALALLAALTLLLASCGGDDDGGAASAPSGETGSNDGASGDDGSDDGSDDDGSTGGGSSGGDLDLCSLFTEEEAEALFDGVVAVRGLIPMVMIEHDESVVTVAVTGTDDDESATSDVAAVVVDRLR